MHSFLLIGQSNMAGRGFLNEAHPINTSHIYTLRNGRWQKMFRPIHADRSFSGVCLAESFAESYAKKHDIDVGLICCADGGTSLDQWKPGEALFDHAVFQAKLAQRTSKIVGILWHQGEADCAPALYATYQERFEKMMYAFRKELDLFDVPFIVGGLGDFLSQFVGDDNLKNYAHINDALINIAKDNEMTAFVSAEGLTPNPDNLHFSAASLYEFGHRYFEEFDKIQKPVEGSANQNPAQDIVRTEMELL